MPWSLPGCMSTRPNVLDLQIIASEYGWRFWIQDIREHILADHIKTNTLNVKRLPVQPGSTRLGAYNFPRDFSRLMLRNTITGDSECTFPAASSAAPPCCSPTAFPPRIPISRG